MKKAIAIIHIILLFAALGSAQTHGARTVKYAEQDIVPIRAKVSLTLRVLTIDDVDFSSVAGSIYLAYQQRKEQLAASAPAGSLAAFGISGVLP